MLEVAGHFMPSQMGSLLLIHSKVPYWLSGSTAPGFSIPASSLPYTHPHSPGALSIHKDLNTMY